MNRRLRAVLMLDVVGYSRLMHGDEDATLSALKSLRSKVIEPCAAAFDGRIVKFTGDGALVSFASVIAAVKCAIALQLGVARQNERANESADETIALRIGLHFAEIIEDGGSDGLGGDGQGSDQRGGEADIFGDGVNIAARLEAQAPVGGILISRAVRDQIRDRLPLTLEDRGELELKNIARPVRAFAVILDDKAAQAAVLPRPGQARRRVRWRRVGIALAILAPAALAVSLAIGFWRMPNGLRSMVANGSNVTEAAFSAQPSVAVLPFSDLSAAHDQALFSDGFAAEILSTLSKSPYLRVVSRNSSFSQAGAGKSAVEIGRLLGARYLVTGTVQRSGDTVRIAAELVDAASGSNLWAKTFDRPIGDIFAVQDEISVAIAASLDHRIERAELLAASRKPPADVTTYDLFLKARSIMASSYNKEATLEARAVLEEVVKRDPDWAPPYAWLGYSYYREMARRWSGARRQEALDKGFTAVSRALELDPTLAFANLTMANLLLKRGAHEEALRWAGKAIELDPNDPDAYAALANILAFINRAGEGIQPLQKALALDPLHPPLFDMYMGRALALSGLFKQSTGPLRDCVRRQPDSWPCRQYLALAYLRTGEKERAAVEFRLMRTNYPYSSVADLKERGDLRPGPQTDLLVAAMAELGLPLSAASP